MSFVTDNYEMYTNIYNRELHSHDETRRSQGKTKSSRDEGKHMGKIDWTEFEGNYVVLEQDTAKTLILTNWRQEMKTFQDDESVAVAFDTVEEDGKNVWEENAKNRRQFSSSSRRLIKKVKPIIQKAEEENRDKIKISIMRVGEKFETQYAVKDLSSELK